jgi:hypothetical protein
MTTLRVSIEANTPALTTGAKQIPFAMSKAINATLVLAQKKQREHMARIFTVRRRPFMERSVKITQFAKKGTLRGEIAIASPGGRDLFEKFELGGTKRPKDGHSLAIPVTGGPVKKTERTVIQSKNRPRALLGNQQDVKRAKSFGGAFIRPAEGNTPGAIFIRTPRGLKLAYTLQPEADIEPELRFEETVTSEVTRTFSTEFEREFANAIKTAK